MSGEVIREPNIQYQGIAISGSLRSLNRYLGSLGQESWEEYLSALSQQKKENFIGRKHLARNTGHI